MLPLWVELVWLEEVSLRKRTRTKKNIKVRNKSGYVVYYLTSGEAERDVDSGRWVWDPTDPEGKTIRPKTHYFFENLPQAFTGVGNPYLPERYVHRQTTALTMATMIGLFRKDDKKEE